MKKLLLFTFFLVIQISYAYAQVPFWSWSHAMGGQNYDVGSGIASDHNGNVVTCGYYYDDTLFVNPDTLLCSGSDDFYLSKYTSFGNLIWTRKEGSIGDDYAISVSCDAVGNSYVTGYFISDTLIIGTDTMINHTSSYSDIFLAKYDQNGNPVWAQSFGGGSWDIGQSVWVDVNSGNVYLAGCYYDSTLTLGTYNFANAGAYDILLAKFDPNGNVIWADHSGGISNDMGNAVTTDNNGNVFISGGFMSASISFGTGTLVNANASIPDIFVAKYDANGTNLWAHRAGGTDNDHSVCVAADLSGSVYVSGHFHSTSFPFASGNVVNHGMGDFYLLKYDANGNEMWGRSAGGMMHDFGYAVAVDGNNDIYVSGMFNSDTVFVGADMVLNSSPGTQDMILMKFDQFGNNLWALSAGGTGDDELNSIAIDDLNAVYLTGDWRSPTLGIGTQNYTNTDSTIGYADILVGKIDFYLGVTENDLNGNSFGVFPNPSNGKFTLNGIENNSRVEIYNSTGQLIFSEDNFKQGERIDISDQPDGIYLIKIKTDNKILSQKIVKS
ncbi:MAG TPA: T9SS type A sorting domain-containing protein [Bacteroidia bacterium]|jgi:hypothetical protein|nr:T9SS type A sorting domain-containing protein [Bacteroidia bacterium]